MDLFLSTYFNKVDKKSRLSIPASFRLILAKQDFNGLIAFKSPHHPAIECFSYSRMQALAEKIDHFGIYSEEHNDMTTFFFAGVHSLQFDSEGRVVLPQDLLQHAQITEQAAVVGRGAIFQIWEPENFKAQSQKALARISKNPQQLNIVIKK